MFHLFRDKLAVFKDIFMEKRPVPKGRSLINHTVLRSRDIRNHKERVIFDKMDQKIQIKSQLIYQ